MESTPERLKEAVFTHFMRENAAEFKASGLPYYMPTWLGGLGLPKVRPTDRNSDLDRKIALRIILNWNKSGGRPADIGSAALKTPWAIKTEAQRYLPRPTETEDGEVTGIGAYQRLSQLGVMNLLFDSDVELETIYKELADGPARDVLKTNRRLWDPKKGGAVPGKMLDERVLEDRKVLEQMDVVFQSDIGDENLLAQLHGVAVEETAVPLPHLGPPPRSVKQITNGVQIQLDFRTPMFF